MTQEVDLLLQKWDVSWAALARAEAKFEFSKCQIRPKHKLGHCLCPGESPCSRQPYTTRLRTMQEHCS